MRHPGRYENANRIVGVDIEGNGRPIGRRALPQVVQHDPRPAPGHGPVVRLVQVVVQAHYGARGSIGPVGLDHFPPKREPAAPVGLDENAPFVPVAVRLHDQYVLYIF